MLSSCNEWIKQSKHSKHHFLSCHGITICNSSSNLSDYPVRQCSQTIRIKHPVFTQQVAINQPINESNKTIQSETIRIKLQVQVFSHSCQEPRPWDQDQTSQTVSVRQSSQTTRCNQSMKTIQSEYMYDCQNCSIRVARCCRLLIFRLGLPGQRITIFMIPHSINSSSNISNNPCRQSGSSFKFPLSQERIGYQVAINQWSNQDTQNTTTASKPALLITKDSDSMSWELFKPPSELMRMTGHWPGMQQHRGSRQTIGIRPDFCACGTGAIRFKIDKNAAILLACTCADY